MYVHVYLDENQDQSLSSQLQSIQCYEMGKTLHSYFNYVHAALDQNEHHWGQAFCQVIPFHLLHIRPPHRTTKSNTDGDWRVYELSHASW